MAEFKHSGGGTVFNMGLATLDRMNMLLNLASEYAIDEEFHFWYNTLVTLRRDVRPFFNEDQQGVLKEKFNEFPKNCWRKLKGGATTIDSDIEVDVPELLDEIDSMIREFMKDSGLLMPKKSDPRFGWSLEA